MCVLWNLGMPFGLPVFKLQGEELLSASFLLTEASQFSETGLKTETAQPELFQEALETDHTPLRM